MLSEEPTRVRGGRARRTTAAVAGSSRSANGPVVAVTGAARAIGAALCAQLVREEGVAEVVGLDSEAGADAEVSWRLVDVCDPTIAERIADCDVVVHLDLDFAPEADPRARGVRNVRGAQTVVTAAAAAGVPRVVVCTSAMVYGASADNEVPLEEDAPLCARPEGVVADLLEIEWLARRAPRAHPGLSVTVVRPAMLVGPGVDTFLTRHFEAARLLVVRGSEPVWQFCHLEDLVRALVWAVHGRVEGVVTCGCEGYLTQEEVEEQFALPRLELPDGVATGAAERLHRLGLTPAPASDLAYVSHPWVVPSARLRKAGWRPIYDNSAACQALLTEVAGRHAALGRRLGKRETAWGAAGAAGAAAALLGTAAVVRRARRRHSG